MTTTNPQADNLRALITGIRFAMLTTRGQDGSLHSRPMAAQDGDGDGSLWFFTDRTTMKAVDITAHPEVNLAYADQAAMLFVSVSGMAELVDDRTLMHARWRPAYATWIPLGADDPAMTLLKVVVRRVDFWTASSGWAPRSLPCDGSDLTAQSAS